MLSQSDLDGSCLRDGVRGGAVRSSERDATWSRLGFRLNGVSGAKYDDEELGMEETRRRVVEGV